MCDLNLQPFFCRIGSKTPIAKKVIDLIPEHLIYIEPFVGSGSIFFKLRDIPSKKVISDLDKRLIDGYKLLKKGVFIPEDYFENKSLEELNEMHKQTKTDKQKLVSTLLDCNTFRSNCGSNSKIYKTTTHERKLKKLEEYKKYLKNVTILNKDYKTVIDKFDSENSFFYLDPPYENSKELYKHGSFNFEELADKLKNIKGLFLLSINDSKNIRNLFKDFHIQPIKVKGKTGNFENPKLKLGTGIRKELLITNYTLS